MKRVTVCLLLVLLTTSYVYAESIRKKIVNPDGTEMFVFYSDGKEVAKQTLDEDENIVRTIGKIPDGTVKEYYKSGKLKAEWNYKIGKLDGMCKVYFENGNLMSKNSYKDDKRDGITKSYYRGLRLKYRYEYYKNGQLAYEWKYKDGKREGMTKAYFQNGSLKTRWNHKGDQLDGVIRTYHKSGGIKYIDTYRDGHKINRKAYDSKGKLEFDQDYPTEK